MDFSEYMVKHKGYTRMRELRSAGFSTRDIKTLMDDGTLLKIKAGLYRLTDLDDENIEMLDCCKAIPAGVICLTSAATYYELSTVNPMAYSLAVPQKYKPPKLAYPPVSIYYYTHTFYSDGIEEIKTPWGNIPIYSREKTICDLYRFRLKLGEDIFLESLRNYLTREKGNANRLYEMAIDQNIEEKIKPVIMGMLA